MRQLNNAELSKVSGGIVVKVAVRVAVAVAGIGKASCSAQVDKKDK